MFAGQIGSPIYREFELAAVLHSFLQNLDTFRIGQTHKVVLHHEVQTFEQCLVDHLVQESQIVLAIIQSPTHAVLDEVLCQIHIVTDVVESHFGFDHPKFGQMAWCVGVLRTERRAESINGTQSRGTQLSFQLSGYGQRSRLAEEIVGIVYLSFVVLLQVIEVLRSHLKHLSGSFAVTARNNRCMKIKKAMFMEITMDGHRHVMTDTEHRTERIGTQTHVGMRTHIFHALSFLLHRIIRAACTQHLYFTGLDLHGLSRTYTLHQFTCNTQASPGRDEFNQFIIKLIRIGHYLYIINRRPVIQSDKVDRFAATARTHPTFYIDLRTVVLTFQYIYNLYSTNSFHFFIFMISYHSNAPMRNMLTSCSVRNLQSPRRTFFFVSPANNTRSSFTTR